jgi:hypothetical protein
LPPPRRPESPFIPNAANAPQSAPKRGAKFDRLNALFGGGGGVAAPPSHPNAPGVSSMDSRMRMERLRGARSLEEIEASCDALLKHFQMPDEQELLCKMLQHRDAGVGERALAELGGQHAKGKLQRTMMMRDALEAFQPRCREPNAQALIKTLLE